MADTRISREDLVSLCDRGLVPQAGWNDRDSAGAQIQLGSCRALLLAGCEFVLDEGLTDRETWWVEITWEGFDWHEVGERATDTFYIPTAERLDARAGKDWY